MFFNLIQKIFKNKKIFINILSAAVIIFLLLGIASCRITNNTADTAPAEDTVPAPDATANSNTVLDETKLIVGCDPTYPVFEFMKDGNVEGFDIDIAREIAERMGRELELVSIDWESTYQIPQDLKLDMIISAVPISSEKEGMVDFSIPYFTMEYMLIVLDETDIKIKESVEGKPIGILNTEKNYLDEDYLLNYKIAGYDDVVMMTDDLKNKNIDGILISLPMGVNLITGNTGIYNVLETVKSSKEFGIVFSKGSPLKEEVDCILEEIKEDGTYDQIYSQWFDYGS